MVYFLFFEFIVHVRDSYPWWLCDRCNVSVCPVAMLQASRALHHARSLFAGAVICRNDFSSARNNRWSILVPSTNRWGTWTHVENSRLNLIRVGLTRKWTQTTCYSNWTIIASQTINLFCLRLYRYSSRIESTVKRFIKSCWLAERWLVLNLLITLANYVL